MKKIHLFSLLMLVLAAFLALAGCASPDAARQTASNEPNESNGAKLWAQNCARCHNSRPPTELSNAQWDVALMHMRVRAGLTAADTHAIREFLQAAN